MKQNNSYKGIDYNFLRYSASSNNCLLKNDNP